MVHWTGPEVRIVHPPSRWPPAARRCPGPRCTSRGPPPTAVGLQPVCPGAITSARKIHIRYGRGRAPSPTPWPTAWRAASRTRCPSWRIRLPKDDHRSQLAPPLPF
jgi:hypothetical protein